MVLTCGLVTISIILPGNGWISCSLNKTYSILDNFGSYFTVYGQAKELFLSIDGPVLVCG